MARRDYKRPPEPGTPRFRITDFALKPAAKYAVFRRSPSGRSAHFQALHESLEKAIEIARMHASESVARGDLDFTYYAVELKHCVGIQDGKPVDELM